MFKEGFGLLFFKIINLDLSPNLPNFQVARYE